MAQWLCHRKQLRSGQQDSPSAHERPVQGEGVRDRRQEPRMLPSLKGLILSKVGNGQAERIYGNQGVGNPVHNRKYKMSDVAFPPGHHVIRRGVAYLFKIHAGFVGLASKVLDRNITHVDLNLITPAAKEGFNGLVFLVFCDDVFRQSPLEIVKNLG